MLNHQILDSHDILVILFVRGYDFYYLFVIVKKDFIISVYQKIEIKINIILILKIILIY